MKEQYVKLIAEFDKTLSLLRGHWLSAKPEEQGEWKKRIDAALDERLRLMALRDSAEERT